MTFIISPNGIKNTNGTIAKFGGGGSVQMGGSFENNGQVEVDIRANLSILGNVVNSGSFHIKDYIKQEQYALIEKAITEQSGESQRLLVDTLGNLKMDESIEAESKFKQFVRYIKIHPELVTNSVQILLQLFVK